MFGSGGLGAKLLAAVKTAKSRLTMYQHDPVGTVCMHLFCAILTSVQAAVAQTKQVTVQIKQMQRTFGLNVGSTYHSRLSCASDCSLHYGQRKLCVSKRPARAIFRASCRKASTQVWYLSINILISVSTTSNLVVRIDTDYQVRVCC